MEDPAGIFLEWGVWSVPAGIDIFREAICILLYSPLILV